jgi:methyl-accepting chemotaxis protein
MEALVKPGGALRPYKKGGDGDNKTFDFERGKKHVMVGETGKALGGIVERVSEIDHLIAEISKSSQEQSGGLNEVNVAVNQMDQFTQQNAAMVEEATAAVGSLKVEAAALARQVARFRMSRAATPERTAVVAPSRPAPSRPARVHRGGGVATAAAVAPDTDGWDEF